MKSTTFDVDVDVWRWRWCWRLTLTLTMTLTLTLTVDIDVWRLTLTLTLMLTVDIDIDDDDDVDVDVDDDVDVWRLTFDVDVDIDVDIELKSNRKKNKSYIPIFVERYKLGRSWTQRNWFVLFFNFWLSFNFFGCFSSSFQFYREHEVKMTWWRYECSFLLLNRRKKRVKCSGRWEKWSGRARD